MIFDNTLVNDVLRSITEHNHQPFAMSPELEAWLLEAADSPTTLLTSTDFDAIRNRVRARLGVWRFGQMNVRNK